MFTVTAVDKEGTIRTLGNDGFAVYISPTAANFNSATTYSPSNMNNGRHTLAVTLTASGAYQMTIRLGGVWEILNAPCVFTARCMRRVPAMRRVDSRCRQILFQREERCSLCRKFIYRQVCRVICRIYIHTLPFAVALCSHKCSSAPDLTIITVGQLASFVVVARDSFGNTLEFDAPALPRLLHSLPPPLAFR